MDSQNDYRQWPNVLALNAKIQDVDAKIEASENENERMALKRQRAELISKRYDQIQFNKELFNNSEKAV